MRNDRTYNRMQDAAPATNVDALALPSALLASVSHDLRNPLAVILGASEALHDGSAHLVGEDGLAYLRAIRRECLRIDEYVKGLFNVTRLLVGGHAGPVRDWVAIETLAHCAVERLTRYRDGARVSVAIETPLKPMRVHGALVEQALVNVLDNAAKFARPGTAVDLRIRQDADGRTEIDVVDSGPGIPAAQRERVFDMFVSEDPQSHGRAGYGLGLAISRAIVRAHGGEVLAGERGDGRRGTRVRLVLPPATAQETAR